MDTAHPPPLPASPPASPARPRWPPARPVVTCSALHAPRRSPTRCPPAPACWSSSPSTAATTGSTPWSRTPTPRTTTPGRSWPTPPSEVLHLDDQLGLNPALTGLAALWKQQAGSRSCAASATRSPTTATSARWTSGRPRRRTTPVQHRLDRPLARRDRRRPGAGGEHRSVLPPLAVGAKCTAAALTVGRSSPLPAALAGAVTGLGADDRATRSRGARVCASYRNERQVGATFGRVLDAERRRRGSVGRRPPAASRRTH